MNMLDGEANLSPGSVALVVGVTGMAGLSLAESLKDPAAPGAPWTVYGVARRPMPAWFPSSAVDRYIALDATDYDDTDLNLSPLSHRVTHLFWVALQVRENEDSNISANTAMLKNVVDVLLRSASSRLRHVTLQTGTKHYIGPVLSSRPRVQLDTPFEEDAPRVPHQPNFYYAQEDLLASYSPRFSHSVHRSSIILGASSRSVYNTLLTLSAYAVICRHEGAPFRFPGTEYSWGHFCDFSDARLLAEQQIWAATTGRNEAFNCTNGDVVTWRSVWRVLCDVFGLGFVEFEGEEFDWVGEMKEKEAVWDDIVEEYGLYETKLEEMTCFQSLSDVMHFGIQHVCGMNKSREFGFFGFVNTKKSIRTWVERLGRMKIIPANLLND